MVTEVDWSLGNITHVLQDVGVWSNTVAVFLSDNGMTAPDTWWKNAMHLCFASII